MVSRSFDAGNFPVLVSTFYSDSWFVKNLIMARTSPKIEIVKYDLTIKRVAGSCIAVRPANARAAAEFQAGMESDDDSTWFHKLLGCDNSFFMLSNESVLVYKIFREIKLCRPTELTQNSNKKKQGIKFISSLEIVKRFTVSVDGRYIYACSFNSLYIHSIVKLSRPQSVKRATISFEDVTNKVFGTCFIPVTNGVFVRGEIRKSLTGEDTLCASNPVPELWNIGVTQRLASFPELTGTCYSVSVAQDLVACIMETEVCFFNVVKKAIVARTPFPEHILVLSRKHELEKIKVIACSSLYHVLMTYEKSTYLLQYANSVDLNSFAFNIFIDRNVACFSPNGQSLAFCSFRRKTLHILDIPTLNIRGKICLYPGTRFGSQLEFVDEEHLLCDGYNDRVCLINVKTCDILICISLDLSHLDSWAVFACRNTVGIIVYSYKYQKFKRTKLWLPQQRKDENELLECSCCIHAANINVPSPTSRSKGSII
jgi:hypothetical protein